MEMEKLSCPPCIQLYYKYIKISTNLSRSSKLDLQSNDFLGVEDHTLFEQNLCKKGILQGKLLRNLIHEYMNTNMITCAIHSSQLVEIGLNDERAQWLASLVSLSVYDTIILPRV